MQISLSMGRWRPVIRRQPAPNTTVAITIDDSPMPDSLPHMLDILDRFKARATFFMSGCRAVQTPELIQETVRRNHAVYAHGWDHIRLDRQPPDRLIRDFDRCETLLSAHRPTPRPYLVRMPYNGGYRKGATHAAIRRWMPDAQIAHWAISTEDHLIAPACRTPDDIDRLCRQTAERVAAMPDLGGAIVLMHEQPINDRPNSNLKPQIAPTLLAALLQEIDKQGMTADVVQPHDHHPLLQKFILV